MPIPIPRQCHCKVGAVRTALLVLLVVVIGLLQLRSQTEPEGTGQALAKPRTETMSPASFGPKELPRSSKSPSRQAPLRDGQPCGELPARFPDSIPPLVHWTSKDGRIATKLLPTVRSWRRLLDIDISNRSASGQLIFNNRWHFMHWDDRQISELIAKHHPRLSRSYGKLASGLERSDIGRLAVLHHVGGLYVDLDVELLRDPTPLLRPAQLRGPSRLAENFSCESAVWSQEPPAHPIFVYNRSSIISNAVMMSRANQTFLTFVLNNWPDWFERVWAEKSRRKDTQAVQVTGPAMLQEFYNNYTALKPREPALDWCANMLADPDVFQPISDHYYGPKRMKHVCVKDAARMNELQRLLCQRMAREKFKEKQVPKSAYTVHKFMHLSYENRLRRLQTSAISSVLPILTCEI
ncbi:hypothetical protein BOX15_Mlig032986g2 [Macrostomum lignano]|uniref:Uncharacterized protein n=1 Tax=Macrostomum lignano TaxID=282301 RepID=A0A267ETY1_9PLAT|nr:hypothetical protein BOX15_Mlig032986g2 [Macrostomum lignano]